MFVGREDELERLREPNWRDTAQLIAVYGRRRVGKTALIEEAYKDCAVWRFDGIEGGSKAQQLRHFASRLGRCDPSVLRNGVVPKFRDWTEALDALCLSIGRKKNEAVVVFFDEFQWMAGMRSTLVSLLKSYWDLHLSRHRKHRLILCGSISSFMVKKVIRSKALYGRVSTEINLQPLQMREIAVFFEAQREKREIIEIGMCFGGIPQYLKELNPRYSLVQNLNEYALRPNGYFFGEFQRIFVSHFGKNPAYETVLRHLSSGPKSAAQLARACHTVTGGTFTGILSDLELAGFLERYAPLGRGRTSRFIRYRLHDEYLHFYFQFISKHEPDILTGKYDSVQILPTPAFAQWQGYAFERLCRRHAAVIADALRFSGIQYRSGSIFDPSVETKRGLQIDLAFDRADKVMTVCEIKHADRLIGRTIINQTEKKCEILSARYPRRGLQKVLIYGKAATVPDALLRYFDHVLHAEDIFF